MWLAAADEQPQALSHLVPPEDPEVTDQMWIDAASANFHGRVVRLHALTHSRGAEACKRGQTQE